MSSSKLGVWFIGAGCLLLVLIEAMMPFFGGLLGDMFKNPLIAIWTFRLFCYATSARLIIYGLALRKLPAQSVDPLESLGQFGKFFPSWMMEPHSHAFYVPFSLISLYILFNDL